MQTKKDKYEYHKQWALRNPDRIAIHKETRRKKEKGNLEIKAKKTNTRLKRKYNITLTDRERIFEEQGGKCKLCYRPEGKFKLHIDHCHLSGRVRGLLCHQCNWYLGKIDRDPDIIQRIINYREG